MDTAEIYDGAVTLLKNENELIPVRKLDQTKIAAVSIGAPADNTFHKYLKKYPPLTTFNAQSTAALSEIKALKEYDLIIISIHSNNAVDAQRYNTDKRPEDYTCIFHLTYRIDNFQASFNNTTVTLIGYDTTDFAQKSAAQGIFEEMVSAESFRYRLLLLRKAQALTQKRYAWAILCPKRQG
jgi:hypothetical protein